VWEEEEEEEELPSIIWKRIRLQGLILKLK